MKYLLIIAVSLHFCLQLSIAQNWKPVLDGKTQYFIGPEVNGTDSIIWGFKTNFSHLEGLDSVFVFNRIARKAYQGMQPYPCICILDTFFLDLNNQVNYFFERENVGGDGIITKLNGDFAFTGPQGDTFFFKPLVPVGTKWSFASNSSDSATMTLRTTALIYGAMDSVLEITTDLGKTFRLSKNHGILSWPFFYPHYSKNGTIEQEGGELFGIIEDGFGRSVPRYLDYYNFAPGDRFRTFYYEGGQGYGEHRQVDLWKIIGPISTTPPLSFSAERKSLVGFPGASSFEENLADTFFCPDKLAFSRLPGEFPFQNYLDVDELFLYHFKTSARLNGRIIAQYLSPGEVDVCLKTGSIVNDWGHDGFRIMGDGIGTVKSEWSSWMMASSYTEQTQLICYAKANELWNGPCDTVAPFIGTDPEVSKPIFSLYPNPANQSVTLDFDSDNQQPHTVSLFDLQGSVMQQSRTMDNQLSLRTEDLPNGMYLVSVENESGGRAIKKLVITH